MEEELLQISHLSISDTRRNAVYNPQIIDNIQNVQTFTAKVNDRQSKQVQRIIQEAFEALTKVTSREIQQIPGYSLCIYKSYLLYKKGMMLGFIGHVGCAKLPQSPELISKYEELVRQMNNYHGQQFQRTEQLLFSEAEWNAIYNTMSTSNDAPLKSYFEIGQYYFQVFILYLMFRSFAIDTYFAMKLQCLGISYFDSEGLLPIEYFKLLTEKENFPHKKWESILKISRRVFWLFGILGKSFLDKERDISVEEINDETVFRYLLFNLICHLYDHNQHNPKQMFSPVHGQLCNYLNVVFGHFEGNSSFEEKAILETMGKKSFG